MLTIYTWPKSFQDKHIATIQRNAVRSWLQLRPKPVIFVFGNAPGTAEHCAEFGLTHVLDPLETIDGTVKIRDMASRVEAVSATRCYCFINADVMLTSSIMQAIPVLTARFERFLLGASPWDVNLTEELTFEPGWEEALARRAHVGNALRSPRCSDLFLHPKGFLAAAPDLIIGRWYVNNGLMRFARKTGAALIDGSPGILTVHQNHHYGHLGERAFDPGATAGALWNLHALGGRKHVYTWRNATHHYTNQGLRSYWAGRLLHYSPYSADGGRISELFSGLIWKPLARITRPIRRPFGLTNPRHGLGKPAHS